MTVDRYTEPQRSREVATTPTPDTAPAAHRGPSGTTDLMRWAEQAQAANQLAQGICGTTFVPQQYRGKPMEAAAAILAGAELGFSPMAALRTFDNIQGTAAPKAITHRAVVQAQGHDIWVVEQTPERAVVRGRRKGSAEVVESVWTIERARSLALTGKDNWKKQPGAMLVARATSECARFVASDALLGMPYSSEELADDPRLREVPDDERYGALPPSQAARGKTQTTVNDLTGLPAAPPEPAADNDDQPAAADSDPAGAGGDLGDSPADAGEKMSQPQQKKLFALVREHEISDRNDWASGVLGREITSFGQLTASDAGKLIDSLENTAGEQ